ncbi:MAG: S-ribosylhomocysteine lyase [Clostridia bacterium]|nr:S-ribosylhomocysteine lyase [Clostridia bacterium]
MQKIASFTVDHDLLTEGMYISRIDDDVTTFDLRCRKPNMGDYIDNITLHSVEHMFATLVRNSGIGENVIYFGPMGCRTGFYLLTRNVEPNKVFEEVKKVLEGILKEEKMYGQSRRECGNYLELDLEKAKVECERYLNILLSKGEKNDFTYKGEKI